MALTRRCIARFDSSHQAFFAWIRGKKTMLRCPTVALQMMLAGCRVGDGALDPRRPQEPKPPYPYEAWEVCYPNQVAGAQF
jgi:hypothetical protein